MTATQVVALLKSHLVAINADLQGKAAQARLVAAQLALRTNVKSVAEAVEAYVVGAYGKGAAQLSTLGFTTAKRQVPTTETQALAAEKRRATRAARGTKGKRQKAGIHGTVTVPATSNPTGH